MSDEIAADEAIGESIRAFLATRDPSKVSLKEIRAHLEEKFCRNLDSKRGLIRSTVESILLEVDAEEEHQDADFNVDQGNGVADDSEDEHQSNGKKKKKGGGGFTKPLLLSEELANFMCTRTASRTEVTKQIWAYIKENDLQNPKNKREVLLDERLQKLMKRKKVTMFSMTKILTPMMKSAADVTLSTLDTDDEEEATNEEGDAMDVEEPVRQSSSSGKRGTKRRNSTTAEESETEDINGEKDENELPSTSPSRTRYTGFVVGGSVKKNGTVTKSYVKQQVKVISSSSAAAESKEEDDENDNDAPPKKKVKASKPIAAAAANNKKEGSMYIQPELLNALGVTKIKTRPALVKKMWEYINKRKLQDSNDKRVIVLDTKLKQVFGVDSFTCFSMNKYLSVLCKPPATSSDGGDNMEVADANEDEADAAED